MPGHAGAGAAPGGMTPVRVLVVDDSRAMRALIRATLERDPAIRVVGEAGDPYEAREAVKAVVPDVITLDVNMPRMDGLAFLERLMRLRPTPVVMVSTEVATGAATTLAALALGAFDCVCKPTGALGLADPFPDLALRVRAAAGAPVAALGARVRGTAPAAFRPNGRVVGIGASTGGIDALLTVLSAFPRDCPPTLVTQHMPASFTAILAERLDAHCAAEVREAWSGAPLEPGRVYLAPGGAHLEIAGRQRLVCRLGTSEPVSGHRPSADVMFEAMARLGPGAVGVILTGMGRDGAAGLLRMREAGAATLGQDPATSLVYGMPRTAHEIGAVERQLGLPAIAGAVLALCAAA